MSDPSGSILGAAGASAALGNVGGGLAIALGGGGARAAYQVGVLRSIATRHPDLATPFLSGVSAGAINISMLANSTANFHDRCDLLRDLWWDLRCDDVFEAGAIDLIGRILSVAARLVLGYQSSRQIPGLVDTAPLRRFLMKALGTESGNLTGIPKNLVSGALEAVSFTTTRYATGQTVTFFAGQSIEAWERPHRISVREHLTVDHIMASAALPLLFPAVKVGTQWYGDGGMRLVAPLAPSLHLGASRILSISTRYARNDHEANTPAFDGPPPPAQVLGLLYNAVFLDQLDQDALTMSRINDLLQALPPERRGGMRETKLLMIRPSKDLGKLAGEFEPDLPRAFRFLTRRLGTAESRSPDFISNVMFQPDYVRGLIALGEKDGENRRDEIDAFLSGIG